MAGAKMAKNDYLAEFMLLIQGNNGGSSKKTRNFEITLNLYYYQFSVRI